MTSSSQTEKVAGRCRNCHRHSAAPDNFCRWCGINRTEASVSGPIWQTNNTTVLPPVEEAPQSVTRLPLDTLTQSVATKTGSLRLNRWGALVIAVLVAIPMWLLIVLLSPFDAYVSAKAAWNQMNVR